MHRRLWAVRLALAVGIVGAAALLTGRTGSTADEPATWPAPSALQVTAVSVDDGGAPKAISLTWPASTGAVDSYVLRRNGSALATLPATALVYVDGTPATGVSYTYTVSAVASGSTTATLGGPSVRFPAAADCTLLWTGGVSTAWENPGNWAPFGTLGAEGAVRAPTDTDEVCVDVSQNLPITVTEAGQSARGITGSLYNPVTLSIDSGDLKVFGESTIPALAMAGGTLLLDADTELWRAGGRDALTLGGGRLQITTLVNSVNPTFGTIAGNVSVLPGTTTTLDGGEIHAVALNAASGTTRNLVGSGGHTLRLDSVLRSGDGLSMSEGLGGASVVTGGGVDHAGGDALIAWQVGASSGGLNVNVDGGQLTLEDLADLDASAGDDEAEVRTFSLFGKLVIGEDARDFVGEVYVGSADGALFVGGRPDPWLGVEYIQRLQVTDAALLRFADDLTVNSLRLSGGADVGVAGQLIVLDGTEEDPGYHSLDGVQGTVTLRVGRPSVFPVNTDLSVLGPVDVYGDITIAGNLLADALVEGTSSDSPGSVTFHDDLNLTSTTSTWVYLKGLAAEEKTRIVVLGRLTLDGKLVSRIPNALPLGTDRLIITALDRVGDFVESSFTGDPDTGLAGDWEAVVADDGLHLVGGGAGAGGDSCDSVPDVNGMATGGCWVSVERDVWYSSQELIAKPDDRPSLGGLTFNPDDGVSIYLDLSQPQVPLLTTDDGTGVFGSTAVTTNFMNASGGVEEVDLGQMRLNWLLDGSPLELDIGSFLGLRTIGTPTVSSNEDPWELKVTTQLPAALGGGELVFDAVLPDLGLEAVTVTGPAVSFAGVSPVEGVLASYLGDGEWSVANGSGSLDARFAMNSGNVASGTMTTSGLTLMGMSLPDEALDYVSATNSWVSKVIAADGSPATTLVETATKAVGVGSRLFTETVDFAIAAAPDGLEFERVPDGWAFGGIVERDGSPVNVNSPLPFQFVDGMPTIGSLVIGGSYGAFGLLEEVALTFPSTILGPALERNATLFELSGEVVAGQISTAVQGTLAFADGTLTHIELPMNLALGELGAIEGVIRSKIDGVVEFVGVSPGQQASFTCADAAGPRTVPLAPVTGLSGGFPAAPMVIPEVCFGPWILRDVNIATAASAGSVDLSASVGGGVVTGGWEMSGGDIGKGTLEMPTADIGDWLVLPALTLDVVDFDGSDGFLLADAASPGDLLRDFELRFLDGEIELGRFDLGDIAIGLPNLADVVADAGEWLPVGGVNIDYDVARQTWSLNGFLEQPRVAFDATLVLSDGHFVSGSVDMNIVDLGPLGRVDLRLDVTGASSFAVVGTWQGAEFSDDRSVGGSLTFADGELASGSLRVGELPIGELFVIDDLVFEFELGGRWALDGLLRTDGDEINVSGAITFDEGDVTGFGFGASGVPLGAFVLDEFEMELDRGKGAEWFGVSGAVRGPAETTSGSPEVTMVEFAGSADWADGRLERFELEIPVVEVPGLAYLRDLSLEYSNSGSRNLTATGTVVTADETDGSTATFNASLADGRLLGARLSAQRVSLGGLVAINDFDMIYDRDEAVSCTGAGGRGATTLVLSGETDDGAGIAGCVTFVGRQLVGGELGVEQIRIGDLLVIDDLQARFASSTFYPAQWQQPNPPASPNLSRSRFDVNATVTAGDLAPAAVTGAIELTDGGLSLFELAIPRVALSSTVELRDLTLEYAQPSRWDGVSDTSFSLSGMAAHDGGETAASGSFTFAPGGGLDSARLAVSDLPLGPVTLSSFELVYDGAGDETAWVIDGVVRLPGGDEFELTGWATLVGGRLEAASLVIPQLSVGELVQLSKVELAFERNVADGSERWFGTSEVAGLGQATNPSTALFEIIIDDDGALSKGLIQVSQVRWGGLFTVSNLVLVGERVSASQYIWTLSGGLSVGNGGTSTVNGQLELRDGVVHTGSLSLRDVKIGELLEADIDLSTNTGGGSAVWSAAVSVLAIDTGTTTSGSGVLEWRSGALHSAQLQLGTVPVGELFTLDSLSLQFETGRRWSLDANITDDDGTAWASGQLFFQDGRWESGSLQLSNLQVGPLDMRELLLTVDSTGALAADSCGIADPGGSGLRFGVQATVGTGDGDTTSIGGRFRLTDGRFTEGVLCGDGIQLADMVLLDDVLLAYSQTGTGVSREVSFDGTATLVDPNTPADSTSASLGFDVRNGQLQRLDLTAGGLNLGSMISLEDVELRFDRGADATSWAFGGTLQRTGASSTRLEGDLGIVDGAIVSGSLSAANLPVGDLFTFVNLQINFHGRRSVPDAAGSTSSIQSGNTTDCAATPSDSNVPVGVGGTTGTGARFSVTAQIQANNETFAVAGSLDFANGKLTQFDVSIACLPIGDFKRIQGLRIGYRGDMFIARGRLQDPDGTTVVEAELMFDSGRLSGGHLLLNDLPLGAVKVDEFELALGENATGDTQFALRVAIERKNGSVVGGGGSLTLRDGRIIAGSILIDELPFMELFTLEDFEVTFDNSVSGAARFAGGARIVVGNGPTVAVDISLVHEDGRLVGGSFAAEAIKLFDAVPLAGFSIAYDGSLSPPQWSGSFQLGFAGNDNGGSIGLPSMQAGVEFRGGRLISALIGFDGNGDGVVDGGGDGAAPPTGGGGGFSGLPLKGMYLKFCSVDAVAAYCGNELDANVWEGRLSFELPTEASPGLDAYLKLVDGRLSEARFEISGLNIPIYAGVFLQSISGNIAVYPRFAVGGGLGITIGPSVLTIVAIDGYMEISEQPDPAPGSDPADYESEWLRVYTEGNANFFNLPIGLHAFGQVDTNGSVAFGGGIRLDIVDNVLYVNGESGGALFNAGALGLTNPRTGEPLTGVAAQLYALVEARVLGQEVASASFYANTIGAMGCASIDFVPLFNPPWGEASVGAGVYWSDGATKLTCDMGKFIISGVDVGPVFATDGISSTRRAEAVGVAEFSEFFVAPGEPILGVHVTGVGGAPSVTLIAPDGTVYDADDGDVSDGTLVATSPDARWFLIGQPASGTWRVQASPSSLPLDEVTISHLLPDPDVAATISADAATVAVDWTATAIPGQQIIFLERSLEGGDDVTAAVGSGLGGHGSFVFTPSGPEGSETRQLVAVVMQDGITRREVVLGTFVAPGALTAGAPLSTTATEVPGGALVSWEAPSTDGGRPITAYRLSSTAGWSLTTDANVFSATLPIPALVPGEEVPVWVQAFTGAGWGEAATATFVSTQTTSLEATPNPRIEGAAAVVAADVTSPTVTVEQGVTQSDPTTDTSVVFDVMFSDEVTGFDVADVMISGTAGASDVRVIGSGGHYRVIVSGMTGPGTVVVSVAGAAAVDVAGNANMASTSVDNAVEFAVVSTPLALTTPADVRVVAGTGQIGAVVAYVPGVATGGIAPVAVSCTPASGSRFSVGTTVVTCTASDAVGATAATSFIVVVSAHELPATGQNSTDILAFALAVTVLGAVVSRRSRSRHPRPS